MLFLNVGERCNIAGSIHQFKKLMMARKYAAMDIAKKQVADGARRNYSSAYIPVLL
jgi:cobalamin-dependent methionine synthase I